MRRTARIHPSDEESGDTWVTVNPPHGTSQPLLKRVTPGETSAVPSLAQKVVVPAAESSASGSVADVGRLSKADRKALKKRLIEERMKREAQGGELVRPVYSVILTALAAPRQANSRL